MRRTARISLVLAALLLAVLAGSCTLRELFSPDEPQLYVRVSLADAVLTRAETGTHSALPTERTVSSLQVWVFRTGATTSQGLIGYKSLDADVLAATGLKNGSATRFSIAISDELLQENPRPNVDVYAVVNGVSAGFTLDKFPDAAGDWARVSPADLASFVLDENLFGVTDLVTEVPAAGLPMAGIIRNEPMTGDFPVLSISTVSLTRAVSKLRFVFCQMTDNGSPVDEFHITGISLSGQIGRDEKLFTDQTFSTNTFLTRLFDSSGYVTLDKSWTSASGLPIVANNPSPGDYLYTTGMSAQEYENIIDGGVSRGVLSQWGLTYLRETDRQLTVSIDYTVGVGASMRSKTATFTMNAPGDFTRNHSWIIYAYFIGGRLVVQPTIVPWIAGNDRLSFTTTGSTELGYEKPWLRYDLDKQAWTWDDTWLVVAYGYEGGSVGRPLRSIMFTLETVNSNNLRLQLNNDSFILLQVTKGTDSGGNMVYTYTKRSQNIDIPASGDKQTTYFYVVPVSDNVVADPYVKVFLTELHSGDGLPPQNIPFNHNLPGDEDHTSILIYNPGAADYDANKNKVKLDGNNQTDFYWLEEAS
ncbi:MAG: hypothetical protein J5640_01945 [Bacteroidales bacterium]|nr:hypothetical protein [Bacteroidales bacterium]